MIVMKLMVLIRVSSSDCRFNLLLFCSEDIMLSSSMVRMLLIIVVFRIIWFFICDSMFSFCSMCVVILVEVVMNVVVMNSDLI